MSGIDIVLHQVLPGFAHHVSCAMLADQIADPAFFHYVLAQLAVSDAQLDPKKEGRAMCEVFGAYGWAEGTRIMKWLADFLLVRGINYFVPHAFSPTYPDPDSPPHFGAEGHDPHFDFEQEICKQLLDQHLNYMILSSDHLLEGKLIDGKFSVNGYGFDVILVPYAKRLPFSVLNALQTLQSGGVTVMFGEALPENAYEEAWAVPYKKMPELLPKYHTPVVQIQGSVPLLRHLAIKQPDGYCFMFFNESITKVCTAQVLLPVSGEYVYISGQTDTMFRGLSVDGRIDLSLKPYESCIVVFGEIPQELPFPLKYGTEQALSLHFTIELADSENLAEWRRYGETDELFNITANDCLPDFAGKIRYTAEMELDYAGAAELDLGDVGENVRLFVNGEDQGIRICRPYIFRVDHFQKGRNTIELIVSNTLVRKNPDRFSTYLQIPPSGLLGPLTLRRYEISK